MKHIVKLRDHSGKVLYTTQVSSTVPGSRTRLGQDAQGQPTIETTAYGRDGTCYRAITNSEGYTHHEVISPDGRCGEIDTHLLGAETLIQLNKSSGAPEIVTYLVLSSAASQAMSGMLRIVVRSDARVQGSTHYEIFDKSAQTWNPTSIKLDLPIPWLHSYPPHGNAESGRMHANAQ
ncbi:hypothetical protein [Thiorhodospira sibirica]|uniref:hypothetical protein n=1 Tax=Thiorhodospira sibirica TaxID=154347 RepID=UPI00022C0571|nr:hypothetical protein [Thiorhodospira sibirica]